MSNFDYGKSVQENVQEQANVVLQGVTRVFETKNPRFMRVSVKDETSKTGFGNIILESSMITPNENGSYDVNLGPGGRWREVSIQQSDGSFTRVKQDVEKIAENFAKEQAQSYSEKQESRSTDVGSEKTNTKKNAYMNRVPSSMIHDVNKPGLKAVSIPMKESSTGFGRILVNEHAVFDYKNMATGHLMPGYKNVNLGKEDSVLKVSLKKGDAYVTNTMTAAEMSAYYQAQRQEYIDSKRKNLVQDVQSEVQTDNMQQESDMDDDFLLE